MSRIKMDDVAVMSVQYVQHTFDYYVDSMERCGLKNVDMWGGAPHYCRLDYNSSTEAAKKIHELRRKMEDHGLKTVIYTPETLGYPFSYSSDSLALRARTLDFMKAACEDALEFGTNRVFLNTGCYPRDLDRERGMNNTIESYISLSEYAKKMGITLMLEQLQPYESNLCINIKDMKRIIDAVDSPALNICVDLVAMEVAGETLDQYFDTFHNKIQWIHYSDSYHMILGDGVYGKEKLKGYIDTLEKHGYDSYLDLEINDSIYWEDPHNSIQRSVDYLKDIL
ncbi:MAG: sugar phosphate isomerase/epimerase [Dorea sp.]|nr:sugar phosphate isomerase/epimerase [Dorea sp.]